MDIIVAILLYIGAISPGATPTQESISTHSSEIQYYMNDPAFQEFYEAQSTDGIVTMDLDAIE